MGFALDRARFFFFLVVAVFVVVCFILQMPRTWSGYGRCHTLFARVSPYSVTIEEYPERPRADKDFAIHSSLCSRRRFTINHSKLHFSILNLNKEKNLV